MQGRRVRARPIRSPRVDRAATALTLAALLGGSPRASASSAAPEAAPTSEEPPATTPSPTDALPSTPNADASEPSTPEPATPTEPPATPAPQAPVEPTSAPVAAAPAEPPAPAPTEPAPEQPASDLPPRLPPMQQAGWWTVFAGFAIGTVGGVLGGVAERQEDKATRLAVSFDLETGSQPLYADVKDDYQQALDRGRAAQKAGIALGVVGVAAVIAGVVVLAVDLHRRKQTSRRTSARRFELRFDRGLQARF